MTWTLAIDTSYFVATGLARDGVPIDSEVVTDTRAHGESLMPCVVELCRRHGLAVADIDEFAVGMGPGPFTGLRVGIAAAATLAHLAGQDLHRVCSLDALALQWRSTGAPAEFVVASDARRKELYWAHHLDGVRVGSHRWAPLKRCRRYPLRDLCRNPCRNVCGSPQAVPAALMRHCWRRVGTNYRWRRRSPTTCAPQTRRWVGHPSPRCRS